MIDPAHAYSKRRSERFFQIEPNASNGSAKRWRTRSRSDRGWRGVASARAVISDRGRSRPPTKLPQTGQIREPAALRKTRNRIEVRLRHRHGARRVLDGRFQHHRLAWRLVEVEVAAQGAEAVRGFTHRRARVGSAVVSRVEALSPEEVVLDELEIRVEAERLMVHVALPRVRADHEGGNADAVLLTTDYGWRHVVVEAAPVVPGEEDRGRAPVRARHDRVDHPGHVRLPRADCAERMLRVVARRDDPRHGRQLAGDRVLPQLSVRNDVAELVVVVDGLEVRQGVPDLRGLNDLGVRLALHRTGATVGLGALLEVVAPAHARLVQQVGDVGPAVVGRLRRAWLVVWVDRVE